MLLAKMLVISLFTLMVVLATNAYAEEQRCKELGANCVCSEPLNTTSYTATPFSWSWNAGDSTPTTKECFGWDVPGTVFERNSSDLFGSNDSTVMNALPAGHTNSFVLRGPEGMTGTWGVGSFFRSTDPSARRAMRIYLYYSPNFAFTADTPSCQNSGKSVLFSYGGVSALLSRTAYWHVYAWGTQFSILGFPTMSTFDCCIIGPGQDAAFTALPLSAMKGKWWRVEAIVRNRGAVPTILQIYMKNVTDNGPEYKVIDTSIPTFQGVGNEWTIVEATSLGSPAWNDGPTLDLFRRDPGQCPGFNAVSHALYAAWSTDAGQRIGAASEIEGGGGDSISPAPPMNLKVQ